MQFYELALITPYKRQLKNVQNNMKYMEIVFSSPAYLNASFKIKHSGDTSTSTDIYQACTDRSPSIDYNEIDAVFDVLANIKNRKISVKIQYKFQIKLYNFLIYFKNALNMTIKTELLPRLEKWVNSSQTVNDLKSLRVFLIVRILKVLYISILIFLTFYFIKLSKFAIHVNKLNTCQTNFQ